MQKFNLFVTIFIVYFALDCTYSADHTSWSYNLAVYEVNTRQYTSAGTFNAFSGHLDRLKELGVGIIWFMPIHPIGEENRLGTLGSPYSVKDYLDINPEYGTIADFKAVVNSIHTKGMYVIIDWVANHTAWDNELTISHPEWYVTDDEGNFTAPLGTNWSDVIQLDYSQQGLREYMIDAMAYWITEVDIDGFRCDAASFLPSDFWLQATDSLKKIKPEILMLAEDDNSKYQNLGFDMSYAWGLHAFGDGILKRIYDGTNSVNDLDTYIESELATYFPQHNRMYFTSNHDENSWHGTVYELFGDAAETYAALTLTMNSVPLVYGGQEAGLNKRLEFFEKDPISWKEDDINEVYSKLLNLKKEYKALWNGDSGGVFQRVNTTNDSKIFAFVRERDEDKLFAVFNLYDATSSLTLLGSLFPGTYLDVISGDTVTFAANAHFRMDAWEYNIYKKFDENTAINSVESLPIDFVLEQNYPNPFNPMTNISYKLPTTGNVKLKIFNAEGRVVKTLVNEIQLAGKHTIKWNGKDSNSKQVASGIYFYQLEMNKIVENRRMLLIR